MTKKALGTSGRAHCAALLGAVLACLALLVCTVPIAARAAALPGEDDVASLLGGGGLAGGPVLRILFSGNAGGVVHPCKA